MDTSSNTARFYGTLDIKTLGGAGFASQRTTGDDRSWNLSDYDGIKIRIGKCDGKKYTFTLKDEILEKNPENGREQSTISYEYDFEVDQDAALSEDYFVVVKWDDLEATYRGKEKKDAAKLDTKNVKRFSVLMRRYDIEHV